VSTATQTAAFAWDELHTNDREKANAFYNTLFGWTAEAVPMGPDYTYHLLKRKGSDESFAGSHQQEGDELKNGVPSHWLVSLGTNDVDAATAKASELGATVVIPPADIPNVGRFSVLNDPQGAAFGLLTYSDGNSAPKPEVGPNCIVWHELVTSDPAASKAFYSSVVGFTTEESNMTGETVQLFKHGGEQVANILPKPSPEAPDAWVFYVEVKDIDETIEAAKKAGGSVIFPPLAIPPIGSVSWLADPTGAVFGILQPSEPAAS
jgi:predicted enzyme related to lactoylglutathione lyase